MTEDSKKAAKQILEEAMKRSGVNPFAEMAEAFGKGDAAQAFDSVVGKIADRIDDSRGAVPTWANTFRTIAAEARALRLRMEGQAQ